MEFLLLKGINFSIRFLSRKLKMLFTMPWIFNFFNFFNFSTIVKLVKQVKKVIHNDMEFSRVRGKNLISTCEKSSNFIKVHQESHEIYSFDQWNCSVSKKLMANEIPFRKKWEKKKEKKKKKKLNRLKKSLHEAGVAEGVTPG